MKIAMGNDHTAIELKNIIKEFVESKGSSSVGSQQAGSTHEDSPGNDGFMNIPDGIDEELPF